MQKNLFVLARIQNKMPQPFQIFIKIGEAGCRHQIPRHHCRALCSVPSSGTGTVMGCHLFCRLVAKHQEGQPVESLLKARKLFVEAAMDNEA